MAFARSNFISFFFSSRRRHTSLTCDWSSDVCSSDLSSASRLADARTPHEPHSERLGRRLYHDDGDRVYRVWSPPALRRQRPVDIAAALHHRSRWTRHRLAGELRTIASTVASVGSLAVWRGSNGCPGRDRTHRRRRQHVDLCGYRRHRRRCSFALYIAPWLNLQARYDDGGLAKTGCLDRTVT